jgi:hypothetical protein
MISSKRHEVGRLLKLRNMRVDLAQIAVQQAHAVLFASREAVQRCRDGIFACAEELKSVHNLMHADPQTHAVRFLTLTEAQISHLKARAVKADDQLREAISEEEAAAESYIEAVALLTQAIARRDGVEEQSRKIRQVFILAQEELQLLELEDSRRQITGGKR